MVSSYELELFAKQAATEYLKDGKSLNESIIKIAADNGLNQAQVARVIEAANTDVYMNLFNKSDEKYIQFDTADPIAIQAATTSTKTAETKNYNIDYYEAPEYEVPEFAPIFEKVAETQPQEAADAKLKDYWRFKAAEATILGMITDGQLLFAKEACVLEDMIKQAVLGGTSYNDISAALSINNDPIFVETLKEVETRLTSNMPIGSMTKTADVAYTHPVNTRHPLFQQSLLLIKIANEYKTLQDKLAQLYEEWELYKLGGVIGETVKKVLKHPAVFGTGLAVGTGIGALALPVVAKETIKRENSPLHNIPVNYRG